MVVAGRRRFTLFPPEQLANLYPGPFELTPAGTPISLVDIAAARSRSLPALSPKRRRRRRAPMLEPGDAIYIPFHWWHGGRVARAGQFLRQLLVERRSRRGSAVPTTR